MEEKTAILTYISIAKRSEINRLPQKRPQTCCLWPFNHKIIAGQPATTAYTNLL